MHQTTFLTLDELIDKLQQQRAAGVPGDTPTAVPAPDARGQLKRIEGVGRVAVAKSDMDKGQGVCRPVATRGVTVLVIR